MRRLLLGLIASVVALTAFSAPAMAQTRGDERDQQDRERREQEFEMTPAPLRERPNAGPCPFVRILYDAARYVEFEGGQQSYAAVGYTGEIEGVEAECTYREADPI